MNGTDLNYCPLGMITRRANSVDEPLQELALREGAENIPPAYPTLQTGTGSSTSTVFLGVGLYVVVVDDSTLNLETLQDDCGEAPAEENRDHDDA